MQNFKKIIIFSLILSFSLLVSGCDGLLNYIGNMMCSYAPDSDHCYQRTAVQGGNPNDCEKIKGTQFKDVGSNPPRDKCYMTIAQNKGDRSVCQNIKGGMMSYTQDECIQGTSQKVLDDAIQNDDPNGCKKLASLPAGYQSDYNSCKQQLCNPEKLKSMDEKIDDLLQKIKDGDKSAQKELDKLNADKQSRYEQMTDGDKQKYFQGIRENLMSEVEDEDVKSAIAKEYANRRSSNQPSDINKMTDKLANIVEQKKLAKELDDVANETVDNIKQQLIDYANKQKDDAIDEVIGMGKDAAEKRLQENGGDDMKYALLKLKRAAEKYDKYSKEYEKVMEDYNKVKAMYDEVMGTYKRIDEVSDMVAKGKITEGQAKVLKGAVLLDKGLEYATEYVPVFGSTISKVSKETFAVVIELAKKRAERTAQLDKCFVDPANCDFDAISAY